MVKLGHLRGVTTITVKKGGLWDSVWDSLEGDCGFAHGGDRLSPPPSFVFGVEEGVKLFEKKFDPLFQCFTTVSSLLATEK